MTPYATLPWRLRFVRSRLLGWVLLVAALAVGGVGGYMALAEVPRAERAAVVYRTSPLCERVEQSLERLCRGRADFTVVEVYIGGGRGASYWAEIEGPAPWAGRVAFGSPRPLLQELRAGQRVVATVWQGRVTEVRAGGIAQRTARHPEGEEVFLAAFALGLVEAAGLLAWGGAVIVRGWGHGARRQATPWQCGVVGWAAVGLVLADAAMALFVHALDGGLVLWAALVTAFSLPVIAAAAHRAYGWTLEGRRRAPEVAWGCVSDLARERLTGPLDRRRRIRARQATIAAGGTVEVSAVVRGQAPYCHREAQRLTVSSTGIACAPQTAKGTARSRDLAGLLEVVHTRRALHREGLPGGSHVVVCRDGTSTVLLAATPSDALLLRRRLRSAPEPPPPRG